MPVRETFVVDDRDFIAGLRRIEQAVAQSAKRQSAEFAAAGKRAGTESADELLKAMQQQFRGRMAQIKEQFLRGMIDRDELRRLGQQAREDFNRGLLAAMEDLAKRGQLSREEMIRLGGALKTTGLAARDGKRDLDGWPAAMERIRSAASLLKGTLVGLAGVMVGRALKGFLSDSVKAAEEATRVWSRLEGAVTNAGVAYEKVSADIHAVARHFQTTTRFGDEAVASALAELIMMTGDYQRSLAELQTALDLAAAKHIDLETAARLVGRAMIGDTSTLKRYGIVVREGADAVAVMREQFRGAAERDGASLSGRLARLRNEWTDVKEALGLAILGTKDATGRIDALSDAMVKLVGWLRENEQAIQDVTRGLLVLGNAAGRALGWLVQFASGVGERLALMTLSKDVREAYLREKREEELLRKSDEISARAREVLAGARGGVGAGVRDALLPEITAAERLTLALERLAAAEQSLRNIRLRGGGTSEERVEVVEALANAQKELEQALRGATAAMQAQEIVMPQLVVSLADPALEEWGALMRETLQTLAEDVALVLRDGFVPLSRALAEIEHGVKMVAEAERDLRHARVVGDAEDIRVAEERLAETKEKLAARIRDVGRALREAGLPTWRMKQLLDQLAQAAADAGLEAAQAERSWGDWARTIEGLARAVLTVADAMGALDDSTRRALQGIVEIASGIGRIAGGDMIGGIAQTLGGAVGVLSALGRRDDPQTRQIIEALEANRRAIERNTAALEARTVGTTPGGTISGIRRALWEFSMTKTEQHLNSRSKLLEHLERVLAAQGLSTDDLLALARKQGLDTTPFEKGNTQAILAFLYQLEGVLQRLSTADLVGTFAGAMELLRREFELLNVTDPAEKIRRIREELLRFLAPGFLRNVVEGLDWNDPEAVAKFVALVLEQIRAGEFPLHELGQLTLEELLDVLADLKRLSESGETGTSRSVRIGQSITEVQAVEVIAWLQDIAHTLREIHDVLSAVYAQPVGTAALTTSMTIPGTAASNAARHSMGHALVVGDVILQPELTDAQFYALWARIGDEVLRRAKGRPN